MRQFILFIISIWILIISFNFEDSFGQSDTEYKGVHQTLDKIGLEYDPDGIGYKINYQLEGTLSSNVRIDPERNSVTFYYDPKGIEEDVLIIEFPNEFLLEPGLVIIDGVEEPRALSSTQKTTTTMIIPLFIEDKEITIIGKRVIPEFSIVIPILILTAIFAVFLGRSKFFNRFS